MKDNNIIINSSYLITYEM